MLYATRIFIGDPFIYLEQKNKRTLVLSDLEIDRARKSAKADEFVMLSELEREPDVDDEGLICSNENLAWCVGITGAERKT